MATRFSEDIRSVSEFKVRAAEIIEQVRRSRRNPAGSCRSLSLGGTGK